MPFFMYKKLKDVKNLSWCNSQMGAYKNEFPNELFAIILPTCNVNTLPPV